MIGIGFLVALGPALAIMLGGVAVWLIARHHEHHLDEIEQHRHGHHSV